MKFILLTLCVLCPLIGMIGTAHALSLSEATEKMLTHRKSGSNFSGNFEVRYTAAIKQLQKPHDGISFARRKPPIDDFWANEEVAEHFRNRRKMRAKSLTRAYLNKAEIQQEVSALTKVYYQALRADRQQRLAEGILKNYRAIISIIHEKEDEEESRAFVWDRIRKAEFKLSRISDSRREAFKALSNMIGDSIDEISFPQIPQLQEPSQADLSSHIALQTAIHAHIGYDSAVSRIDAAKELSINDYKKAWRCSQKATNEISVLREKRKEIANRKRLIMNADYLDWIQITTMYQRDFQKSLEMVDSIVVRGVQAFAALDIQGVTIDFLKVSPRLIQRAPIEAKAVRLAVPVKRTLKSPPAWKWSRA